MRKLTKTWAIGEYAKGGVITAEIDGKEVTVIGKEWDESVGWSKNSDQSNAKEFTRITVIQNSFDAKILLDEFLNDLTSSYYAEEVLSWIKKQAFI
jgi:hypothetical protein